MTQRPNFWLKLNGSGGDYILRPVYGALRMRTIATEGAVGTSVVSISIVQSIVTDIIGKNHK